MKKIILLVLVLVLVVIPSGNVDAQGACPGGEGWMPLELGSMPTSGMTIPLNTKDGASIYAVCINGNVYGEDISGGNFEISGLGSGNVIITSHGAIEILSISMAPVIPTTTPTSTVTVTPVSTATSVFTSTPITTTPVATATSTSVATTTETLSATKPIAFVIGLSLALVAILMFIAFKAFKKKKR